MNIVTKKTFSKETEGKKKRRRITHTCFACKKRKTKCDRKRPRCGTCVDLGINECKYFESPFSNITSEIPEVNNDSKTVKKLFTRQKVNVEQLWHKKKRVTYYGLTSFRPISEQYSVKKFRDHVSQQRRLWKQQNKDSSRCMVLKYSVGQDSLSECLPSYLDTLGLLQKFFDSIWYQAYPIVCQDTVIEDFISIFSSDGSRIVVSQLDSIKSPRIALILLLVECMMQEDELKGEGVVQRNNGLLDQATSLVLRGDALKYSSLPTLQVLLLLRIHKRFNMRDNDGGDGSSGSILHSICFNMAISMGLHREIDSLYGEEKPATINVLKNIWMCLLHLDCLNSLELGLPLQIGEDFLENFSSDSDYTTTKFIETMRFCVNKSTKKEVFVEDLLACIIEIKAFLRTSEVSSLIETFFRIDPQHCSNLDYKDLVIKFCKIFPVFSILSHYYQILLIDESSFKDESVVEIFKSSVAKYNCLSLVFTGGFFQSLIGTYNLEDYSSWSQLYLFACGLFEMPCRRAVLSSIGLIDGLKTSRYEKKIIHLEMDKILLNHLPEQDIIESFGFDYRDPLVLNQCVSYCTAMIMKVPVVASLRLKSYSFNIIVMQYILFIDSYFKDAQNLSLSRYNVDLVIGDAFSLNPENPHPSSLESTDIGTKRKVFSYDLLFDIEKFMHENLDEALLSEMVWI